ncbi:aminoglycoside phosphotransferase family protein [Mycobacterium sp. SMC-4]|uniref:aminoglycoside phosphotransferase family protein n=1 Tax=Mycobacterium sp. SMC-4 TaxID=2857059 RepID=UPI003D0427B3
MTVLDDLVADWGLVPDGDARGSGRTAVLPVRADGSPAVLKVGGSEQAHLALRRWNGDGAVRLLRADPRRNAVLVERLGDTSLESLFDAQACEVIGGLYAQLHVQALPQLSSLAICFEQWAEEFTALPNNAPLPHRLIEQAATLCGELRDEPSDALLHGNLHYANVLAAERSPWLAISPTPINGDPAYEIAPMLWHRWDDIADNVRFATQRRFYALIDSAGLDEDRARAFTVVRLVHRATQVLDDPHEVTKLITLAKAVQD